MDNNNNNSPQSSQFNGFEQNQRNENEKKVFNKTWDLYVYTVCMIILGLNYGLLTALYSPALVDFKYMFHTSLNDVSFTNLFRNIGYLLGSLFGFIYSMVNRQLVIAIMVCVLACFTAALPFYTELWQLYLSTTISMIGGASFECAVQVWLVEIWGKNSAPILQLNKAVQGVGAILGPLIDAPFVVGELKLNNETQYQNLTAIKEAQDQLNYSIDRRPKLEIPFLIGGGTTLPIPMILFVMYLIKRYRPPKAEKEQVANEIKSGLSTKDKYVLIGLIAVSLSTYSGMELIHQAYSSTYYQNLPIHLSAQKGALIMSVMSATTTVGKLLSAFVSVRLKPETMIIYSYVILAVSMAILYFGYNSELIIWIGNCIIGLGFAAPWSAYFSLAENHMGLTNKMSSVILAVVAICPMLSPIICGPLIEKNPQVFLYTELVYFIISVILFVWIFLILRRSSKSLKKSNEVTLTNIPL